MLLDFSHTFEMTEKQIHLVIARHEAILMRIEIASCLAMTTEQRIK